MQRFLGIILFFIFIVGCKSDQPANIIKEKEMANLLLDLHLAEGYAHSWPSDSSQSRSADFVAGVYEHYHTDSATVRESIEYYATQPQVLNRIYVDVDKRLKAMETNVREIEEKRYREIFVRDSIRNAFVADSLLIIKNDSIRYAQQKYLLYWKSTDSINLKPEVWDWKKETAPSKRFFNYTDSVLFGDSLSIRNILLRDSIAKKDSVDKIANLNVKKDTIEKESTIKKAISQKKLPNSGLKKMPITRLKSTNE